MGFQDWNDPTEDWEDECENYAQEPPYENDKPTEAELEEMAAMRYPDIESIYDYLKAHPEYD